MGYLRQEHFYKKAFALLRPSPQDDMNRSMKRYTLNVTKEVYVALQDLRTKELRKQDKAPSTDQILRKLLKLDKPENQ